ncbi:hypothetical protein C7M84_022509 [Penaeus vannamei]|uniref:Uncharacterized protein n=1 Tax=Penaeus vannamei TaxID=6689 RepID=A0A423U6L5_PENVA|nr:hypothetical protein C7M84_022509 [Penaeus vannamei]
MPAHQLVLCLDVGGFTCNKVIEPAKLAGAGFRYPSAGRSSCSGERSHDDGGDAAEDDGPCRPEQGRTAAQDGGDGPDERGQAAATGGPSTGKDCSCRSGGIRSNGSQVPSAVQLRTAFLTTHCARPSSPIRQTATREDLQEWQRQLEERERRIQRQEQALFHSQPSGRQPPAYRRMEAAQGDLLAHPRSPSHFREARQTFPEPAPRLSTPVHPRYRDEPAEDHLRHQQPSLISRDVIPYLVSRDSIPHFKGETSACEPLKRNQEVESYIRAIENLVRPATDDAYIRAARASCRGRAETIINSESFDGIQDWDTFKRQLRRKFRGTYSASDFFKVLYDHGMTERQAPMDFFLEVEASVFQGYRDHRGAVGEPSELIRRVFLAGLPSTLRDLLVLKDDCSPIQLAETAQKLWNSRYGIRHSSSNTRHQSPNNIQEDDYQLRRRTPDRPPRTRDRYDLFPVATSPPPAQSPLSSPPTSRRNVWCEYHRSSPTAPGNAELLPVSLHHQPTLVSVVEGAVTCLVSAPFREARKEGFPTSLATLQEGTRTRSITVQTEPVQTTAAVTTPAVGGRPVVALSVDGKTLLCFIDTGSQVTLVKPSALEVLDPAKKLRHHASSKILQGVSGEPSTQLQRDGVGRLLCFFVGNSEEWDIEDAFLPPSVAVATCEAVTDDDDPGPDDPDVPDLDAEDSVGPSQDPDVEDVDADADPADPAPDTDVEDVDADGPIADVRADFTGGPDDDVTP